MKTLKALLKDLLKPNNPNAGMNPEDASPKEETVTSENENQNNLSTQKQNENETETDENSGNPGMDNPDARETAGNTEKQQEFGDTGDLLSGGETGEGVNILSPSPETIAEAYEKGVIDGRNSLIEEKYFPSTDDGIPDFHGRHTRNSSSSDIFSMAREA